MNQSTKILLFFAFSFWIFLACTQSEQSPNIENKRPSQVPECPLHITPPYWKPGDSLIVSYENMCNKNGWRPGTAQIALPEPEPQLLEGQHFQLLWIPKIESSDLESANAIVYYGIVSPDEQFEIVSEFKYEVEKDNLGKFYFSTSPALLSVDTIYYHD